MTKDFQYIDVADQIGRVSRLVTGLRLASGAPEITGSASNGLQAIIEAINSELNQLCAVIEGFEEKPGLNEVQTREIISKRRI